MNQNRYQILKVLGQSQQSRTCWALDQEQALPQVCVIKQVQSGAFDVAAAETAERFKALQHPGLPRWLDIFNQGNTICYVQEYIKGDSLASLIKQRSFSAVEIWQILERLLSTLSYLHIHGLTHGDVKPGNILCRSTHQLDDLVLVDCAVDAALVNSGNPEYAAPEQIQGQAVFASDLYSLGLSCIHLLTGVRPIEVLADHDWQHYWTPEPEDLPHSEKLIPFLNRLIAPDLNQRFATAAEAIASLESLRGKKLKGSATQPKPQTWDCIATLSGHQGLFASVNAVAISIDAALMASASDDKTIRLWELPLGTERSVLLGHSGFVKAVAFQPQQPNLLASGSHDRTVKLWDCQTEQVIWTLTGHTNAVNTVAFSPDGSILASGSSDKTIKLWQVETGDCLATLSGHRLAVNALAFTPSLTLISASADATLRLWDIKTGTCRQVLNGHTQAVRAVAINPPDHLIASGGEDGTIRLWNSVGECIQTLPGHAWSISALAFLLPEQLPEQLPEKSPEKSPASPNLPLETQGFAPAPLHLISASWDKTLKLWQLETAAEIACLSGHTDAVTSLALASDQILVSASKDKTIKLWRVIV